MEHHKCYGEAAGLGVFTTYRLAWSTTSESISMHQLKRRLFNDVLEQIHCDHPSTHGAIPKSLLITLLYTD